MEHLAVFGIHTCRAPMDGTYFFLLLMTFQSKHKKKAGFLLPQMASVNWTKGEGIILSFLMRRTQRGIELHSAHFMQT